MPVFVRAKVGGYRDNLRYLSSGKTAISNAFNTTIIVSDEGRLPCVNQNKSVDMQLGTWRGKSMPLNNVVDVGQKVLLRW